MPILEEACNTKLIQLSAKNWPPPSANKSKYCRYHRVAGHNTKDCTTLKDKIEKIIQMRHPKKFIKDPSRDKDYEKEQDRSWERGGTCETTKTVPGQKSPTWNSASRYNQHSSWRIRGEGSLNSEHKCYVRNLKSIDLVTVEQRPTRSLPPITFTDEDFEG